MALRRLIERTDKAQTLEFTMAQFFGTMSMRCRINIAVIILADTSISAGVRWK